MCMKKIFLAVLIALSASFVFAQEPQTEESDWRTELQRHELGIGIGDCAFATLYRPDMFWGNYSIQDVWFNDLSHAYGPTYSTCPISFHYLYRVTKFLWLGGEFSYCGMFYKNLNYPQDLPVKRFQEHYLTLMPTIRFSYLNKKYVTLYSGLSTGVCVGIIGQNPEHQAYVTANFAGQLTAFGVSAGNKWYGFTEIGLGYNGIIRAGFGCRFNRNNN